MIKTPLLILGGNGMLGQDLARVFSSVAPIVWDRAELDITNAEAVRAAFEKLKPGTVINAAAYNLVDKAEEEDGFAIAMAVNAKGPGILAAACKAIGATFLHFSTDYVFEGIKPEGYPENATPNPQSKYGQSKRAGEDVVLAAGGNAYIIRTCRLFGKLGASEGSKQSFVDLMLSLAEKRDTLDVVDEEVASPTYTPDLARQTRLLLEGEYLPGIYHATNTGSCTWYAFAQEIFRLTGKQVVVNPVSASRFPRPAKRPSFSALQNTKLPQMRSWQEALADYLSTRTQI
jgi:dTDP-4-dehydrorhamnose reductase